MTVYTWLTFYLLFSKQSRVQYTPCTPTCSCGKPDAGKTNPYKQIQYTWEIFPHRALSWKATAAKGNSKPMNAKPYPRGHSGSLAGPKREEREKKKRERKRTSNWTLWKTQRHVELKTTLVQLLLDQKHFYPIQQNFEQRAKCRLS